MRCCGHSSESSGSIKCVDVLDYMRNYYLRKKALFDVLIHVIRVHNISEFIRRSLECCHVFKVLLIVLSVCFKVEILKCVYQGSPFVIFCLCHAYVFELEFGM